MGTLSTQAEGAAPAQLDFMGEHPLAAVLDALGEHLEIGVDCIGAMLLLSRLGGRMGQPFNLAIHSEDPGAELIVADRIVNIVPENTTRVTTIQQVHELSRGNFAETELIISRNEHDSLYRVACEAGCKDLQSSSPPSVWLISDERSKISEIGPTLVLMANQAERSFVGFGHFFSTTPDDTGSEAKKLLRQLILLLKSRHRPRCSFEKQLRACLRPSTMLIVNRLLAIVAAVRIEYQHLQGLVVPRGELQITIDDYLITRELLRTLPTPGQQSSLSPSAAETATIIFDMISETRYQLTIPDNSSFGKKTFTTRSAADFIGLSYNTAKCHLKQLEDEGIVESLVVSSSSKNAINRGQGRQIFFRFVNNRSPPFGVNNQFDSLPTAEQIAGDCINHVQT